MSATPRSFDAFEPRRRFPEPFEGMFRELGRRFVRLYRDTVRSRQVPRSLIAIVFVEQVITLLVLWLDDLVPNGTVHVLVSLGSLLASFAVLVLVVTIRDLRREATTDSLTGALNRAGFECRLQGRDPARGPFGRRFGRGRRVLVAFDLDGFKGVNDTFGHAAGDGVLREIVRRMRIAAPRGSLIGRPGGDEFALALHLDEGVSAMAVVEAIRAALVIRPIVVDGASHRIGVTAGVAIREPGEPLEALATRADLALVAGKLRAKNRSHAAPPTTSRDSVAERVHGVRTADRGCEAIGSERRVT